MLGTPDPLRDRFEVIAPCCCAPNRYRTDPVTWPPDLAAVLDEILGDPPVCAGTCAASSIGDPDTGPGGGADA